MRILGEMKRRNVYRVGIAYIVAGWAIIQLGYVIAADAGAPAWVMGLVVTFVVAGFPIAMFFTWTFAWTKQGIRKETDVNENPQLVRRSGRKLDYITMALLAAVVGMIFLDEYMPQPPGSDAVVQSPQPIVPAEPPRPIVENSIAVLPFVNMSAEANQDYFSDGLSEELLNVLTQVDGLFVASRTSSFAFKGTSESIHNIAQTLRVANVLEGSVRKVGDQLRITAQLIDADTDVHLWSDSYDRDMTDIFQIQDEIANAIVAALTTEMGVGVLESVKVVMATSNLDAYDLYLKAREMFIARENLPTSWQLLQKATSLDPDFARAWETLSAVRSVATSWFPGDGIDHESLALAAARKALELDPGLSMPHAVIGMKHQITGEGYPGAIASLDKALENDPRNGSAWLWRGITFFDMGYAEKALADFEGCLNVDPGYLNCRQYEAMTLMTLGQIEEGVRKFEATLEANFHSTDDTFVSYYVQTGQRPMAMAIAALAMRDQFAPVKHWIEAVENPDEDHSARVAYFNQWGATHNIDVCDMDSLAIALRQDHCLPTIENATQMWLPDTAYFRKKPAFKEFVNTHLMAYWQENGFPSQCRALEDGDFECD
jgi:TolB-like protein